MRSHRSWALLLILISAAFVSVQAGRRPAPALAAADFALPFDWQAKTTPGSPTPGYDPLNVVIAAHDATLGHRQLEQLLHDDFLAWTEVTTGSDLLVDACISEQDAAVHPGSTVRAAEDFNWRRDPTGCNLAFLTDTKYGHNHVRGYLQTAAAWFLGVSEEHFCHIPSGPLTGWHCIDPDGFNLGRDHLLNDFAILKAVDPGKFDYSVSYLQAYAAGTPPQGSVYPRSDPPSTQPSYDGVVAVVTVTRGGASHAPQPVLAVSSGATLCENPNNGGRCVTYTFDTPYVGNAFNDIFSAVRLVGGATVSVYEHANYGGRCQVVSGDLANLAGSYIGDNAISSLRIGATCPAQPPASGATLCTNADYTGQCLNYTVDTAYVGNALNDQFSSILPAPGATISVFQDANYGGRCQSFSGNVANLTGSYIGNDQISSLRFGAVCPAPPAPTGYAAAWQGDSYDGRPLTDIYMDTRTQSHQIFNYLKNVGRVG